MEYNIPLKNKEELIKLIDEVFENSKKKVRKNEFKIYTNDVRVVEIFNQAMRDEIKRKYDS